MTHLPGLPVPRDGQPSPAVLESAKRLLADLHVGVPSTNPPPRTLGAPVGGDDRGAIGRAAMLDGTPARQRGGEVGNRLLAAIPAPDLALLRSELKLVDAQSRDVLFEPDQPIENVYFPESAVLSLVSGLREGGAVEVGTVGCEGMAGLPVFLGASSSSVRAIAQIPGTLWRLDAGRFRGLASVDGPLHHAMLRYTQAFLTQVAQTAVCNGSHLVVQRCARWLLMTHDRVRGDELELTHEFLAFMLGVRRAGVTVALQELQQQGLVTTRRGRVVVVDRAGLERASCECYQVVRDHFERALGVVAS